MNWKTSVLIKELMKFTDFSYLDKGDDFLSWWQRDQYAKDESLELSFPSKVFCSPRNENMNFLVWIKFLNLFLYSFK